MMKSSGLALALCLAGLAPAYAQDQAKSPAPEQVAAPASNLMASQEPVQQALDQPNTPAPMDDTVAIPQPSSAPVQVQALAAPDVFSAGARDTGLSRDLWTGSAADMAREILLATGTRPLSPAGAVLARRILATGAAAPAGASDDLDLAASRLRALLALGDAAAVEAMSERTPGVSSHPGLAKIQADAALVLGHADKACNAAATISSNRDDPFWLRLRSYCQALAGQTAAASLTMGLAEAQKPDPEFSRLMGMMLTGGQSTGNAALRTGLDLALSRTLGLDLKTAIASAPAAIAVALARDEATEPGLRLLAAGRAARFGATVSEVFDNVASQPDHSAPDAQATPPPPPPLDMPALLKAQGIAAEARLLAIGRDTNDLTLRDQIVINLLKRAQNLSDFMALAKLAAPQIAGLARANVPSSAPVLLATAALCSGDLETGRIIRQTLPADIASDEVLLLDAMITLATGPSDAERAVILARLTQATQIRPTEGSAARRQVGAVLTAALTANIAPAVRSQLAKLETGHLDAPASRLMALDLAAEAKLQGETALAVLAILNVSGGQGPGLNDRARLVRGLAMAGLGPDATALAMEGIVLAQNFASAPPPKSAAKATPKNTPKLAPKRAPRPAAKPPIVNG